MVELGLAGSAISTQIENYAGGLFKKIQPTLSVDKFVSHLRVSNISCCSANNNQ